MVDTSIFVFELAEQTLGQYAAKTKQLEAVRAVVYKVANAVCQMHKNNVVYNDLKPENIQLVKGQPKLSDFDTSLILAERRYITTTPLNYSDQFQYVNVNPLLLHQKLINNVITTPNISAPEA